MVSEPFWLLGCPKLALQREAVQAQDTQVQKFIPDWGTERPGCPAFL